MLRALRNGWRFLRLALSLARHDALFPLEILGITPALVVWARLFARRRDARRPGERLTAALQEMGPSFIKLGQALSTRAEDRKSTRLNSSHLVISYAVFC